MNSVFPSVSNASAGCMKSGIGNYIFCSKRGVVLCSSGHSYPAEGGHHSSSVTICILLHDEGHRCFASSR